MERRPARLHRIAESRRLAIDVQEYVAFVDDSGNAAIGDDRQLRQAVRAHPVEDVRQRIAGIRAHHAIDRHREFAQDRAGIRIWHGMDVRLGADPA